MCVWLQYYYLPKVILVYTEPQVQFSGVILEDPFERVVVFTVLPQQHTIKRLKHQTQDRKMHNSYATAVFTYNSRRVALKSYHRLHVFKGDLLAQHHLVERSDEKACRTAALCLSDEELYGLIVASSSSPSSSFPWNTAIPATRPMNLK